MAKKPRNAKNLKIKFQQRRVKLEYSFDEKSILLQFFATFSNKTLLLECFLPMCNNFSDQNCLDKSVLINGSRFNHTSLMNNIVAKKNQTPPSIIHFRSTNNFKTRMVLLSYLINHYPQTRFMRLCV